MKRNYLVGSSGVVWMATKPSHAHRATLLVIVLVCLLSSMLDEWHVYALLPSRGRQNGCSVAIRGRSGGGGGGYSTRITRSGFSTDMAVVTEPTPTLYRPGRLFLTTSQHHYQQHYYLLDPVSIARLQRKKSATTDHIPSSRRKYQHHATVHSAAKFLSLNFMRRLSSSSLSLSLSSTAGDDRSTKESSSPPTIRWERRLLRVLFLPIRRFFQPLIQWIINMFLDDLEQDGTVNVSSLEEEEPAVAAASSTEEAVVILSKEVEVEEEQSAEESEDAPQISQLSSSSSGTENETIAETEELVTTSDNGSLLISTPKGDRWSISAADVDLTGDWKLVVTDDFKVDYDAYLKKLGQKMFVREVALAVIGQTTEEIVQSDRGKSMLLKSKNVRGMWTRTLVASGADEWSDDDDGDDGIPYERLQIPITTADGETVQAEAWWEDHGRVHVSWMRGVRKYGGGDFESRRYLQYLDDDEKAATTKTTDIGTNDMQGKTTYYICESSFHPKDKNKGINSITWKFERQ